MSGIPHYVASVRALAPQPGTTILVGLGHDFDTAEQMQGVHDALVENFPGVKFVLLAGAAAIVEDTLPQWLAWRFGKNATTGSDWAGLSEGDRAYWAHEADAVRRAVMRGGFKDPEATDG